MPALTPIEQFLLFIVAPVVLAYAVLEAVVLSWVQRDSRGGSGYD